MNSATLQGSITKAEESSDTSAIQRLEPERVKILGLNWDCEANEFYFDLTEVIALARSLPPTRRSLPFCKCRQNSPIL